MLNNGIIKYVNTFDDIKYQIIKYVNKFNDVK